MHEHLFCWVHVCERLYAFIDKSSMLFVTMFSCFSLCLCFSHCFTHCLSLHLSLFLSRCQYLSIFLLLSLVYLLVSISSHSLCPLFFTHILPCLSISRPSAPCLVVLPTPLFNDHLFVENILDRQIKCIIGVKKSIDVFPSVCAVLDVSHQPKMSLIRIELNCVSY